MKTIAIIPARAGSKGVPRKNIRDLAGRPLLAWTVDAARKSTLVSRVIVSTDSQEIADVAAKEGAEIPYLRAPELANDTASSVDVVLDLLEKLDTNVQATDRVVLLQPTSPLRTAADIDGALQMSAARNDAAVVSVTAEVHPPQWLQRQTSDGHLEPWTDAEPPARRQDFETLYRLNGAIYVIAVDALRRNRTFLPKPTYAYEMPAERSLDIDAEWDLHVADLIMRDLVIRGTR